MPTQRPTRPETTLRNRLEMQGFLDLDDETLLRAGPWLRLAPASCAAWAALGLVLWSPGVVLALVPFAALGVVLRNHPFDLVHTYVVARRTGAPSLPRHGAPRRFACGVATLWLLGLAYVLATGPGWLGRLLGVAFVISALIPATTDFCIPSWLFSKVMGRRTKRVVPESA